MRLSGVFFEPLSSKKLIGEIKIADKRGTIFSEGNLICNDIGIETYQNKTDIYLQNGILFTLDYPLTNEQEKLISGKITRGISWLEKFSIFKAFLLGLFLISSLLIFRYSLNIIVPAIVYVFPPLLEKEIGQNTYEALKLAVFEDSELKEIRIKNLQEKASEIAISNGFESPQIFFHKSDLLGANALAFPGGPVVVTDELVLLLQQDDLILSVIAHEFAHIQERHSLQHIVEMIGIGAMTSVMLGANDTLLEEASVVALNIWSSKKSRNFEKQADLLGLQYLETADFDSSVFSLAIEKLTDELCHSKGFSNWQECSDNSENRWFSSHPSHRERLKYLSK